MQCRLGRRILLSSRPARFLFFRPDTLRGLASFQRVRPKEKKPAAVKKAPFIRKAPVDKSMFQTLIKQRDFSELIIMIKSYLMGGSVEHAEILFGQVKNARMSEWLEFSNGASAAEANGLLNMFVKAYLDLDKPEGANEHIRAQGKHKNTLTFALLLRYHLGKDDEERCRAVLREMRAGGFLLDGTVWSHLHRTRVLSRAELDRLIPLAYSVDGVNEEIAVQLDGLAAEEETTSPQSPTIVEVGALEQIRSVESNSHGIDFIKKAVSSLRESYGKGKQVDAYMLQERLERDCSDAAAEQFKQQLDQFMSISGAPNLSRVRRLLGEWHHSLAGHLQALIASLTDFSAPASPVQPVAGKTVMAGTESGKMMYAAMLSSMTAEKISIIVLQELTRISAIDSRFDGIPLARIATNIGSCLEREIFAQQICKKDFLAYVRLSPKQRNQLMHNRRAFNRLMERTRGVLDDSIEARQAGWIPAWSTTLKAEIGAFVANEAIGLLKFRPSTQLEADPADLPAFRHELVSYESKRFGVVKLHPSLFDSLAEEPELFAIDPTAMPMVVPPNPWLAYNQGGYLTQKTMCVRLKEDPVHLSVLHDANANGKMDGVLQGLDILGQTAWRINERVLRVAIGLWNDGVNVATLEKPPAARTFDYRPPETFPCREAYRAYLGEKAAHIQAKGKAHSTMCDTNYKLEIARQFCGIPFYLPHSVDFRGRAYPIPPHLSHIGSDLSRSLLVFAEGRPLGERGLFWLKVQLANMFGFDKHSLVDRASFADEHLAEIRDSAGNPLGGQQWWRKADEPWQCLAACMELDAALSSPDPAGYVSAFPVQQDGSCNGLQHYAALGRDVGGANKVNLSPSDRPQDIYGAVATLVSERIEQDCAKGNEMALRLRGKINRKIIKQPVMTNVYGVTPFGARAQIQERLKEYNIVPQEHYVEARKYLCDLVFSSLNTLFDKAKLIQDWLTHAAHEISRAIPRDVAAAAFDFSKGALLPGRTAGEKYRVPVADALADEMSARYPQTSVSWDTPLQFRVVQPYLKSRMVHLRTVIQTLSLKAADRLDPVDVGKQVSAFPPNFVHSLDATHMFMTAQACFSAGITFASVHDCFWTHASTVDTMNRKIREQFVELYEKPVLASLREDMLRSYGQYVVPVRVGGADGVKAVPRWRPIDLPPVPEQGDFDIKQVLSSQYFFS